MGEKGSMVGWVMEKKLGFEWATSYGLNGLQKKFWLGQIWAQEDKRGLAGRVWDPEKNPINNRAGSGSRVLAHRSGSSMQKPVPNLTRFHY